MGLNFICSSNKDDRYVRYVDREVIKEVEKLPNPDPKHFSVMDFLQAGRHLIVKVVYPNCTNYEGVKIMVYANMEWEVFSKLTKLDPHFSKLELSPVARFEPTNRGWALAQHMCISFDHIYYKDEENC